MTRPLGWPGPDVVSRETETSAPLDASVSRETVTEAWGAPAAAERALAAVVSRETSDREELVQSLPTADYDTPLAQAVAEDARKRIALTGRTFPRPAQTRILT